MISSRRLTCSTAELELFAVFDVYYIDVVKCAVPFPGGTVTPSSRCCSRRVPGFNKTTPSCVFAVFFVELSHEFAQYTLPRTPRLASE